MIDRLLASRYTDALINGAVGAFSIALGLFLAGCLLIGMAVVFDWIAGVM